MRLCGSGLVSGAARLDSAETAWLAASTVSVDTVPRSPMISALASSTNLRTSDITSSLNADSLASTVASTPSTSSFRVAVTLA